MVNYAQEIGLKGICITDHEALGGHVELDKIQQELIAQNSDFKGWIIGVVDVPIEALTDKAQRINITLPARVLRRLDVLAKKSGDSRSGYIARMVLNRNAKF